MESKGYRGNVNLKPKNKMIGFTQEQIIEYIKCSQDPVYFIKKYIKIVNVDQGLINLNLYPYQEKIVREAFNNNRVLSKFPRQAGKTTSVAAFAIHQILFNENFNVLIAANKGKTATEIMKKIQDAYQYLPSWLQQGIIEMNKSTIFLENGSRIITSTTSGDAARGFSFNTVILDEFAFLKKNIADEFFTSIYPTISSGKSTKLIIISTPNGLNHFYKMWIDAIEKRTDFVPIEIKWNDVPGRDEEFKQKQLRSGFTLERWRQEFESEFLGSSNTLISSQSIQNMTFISPEYEIEGVKFYEKVQPGHRYFISVDTAEGLGLDYHAMTVIDITERPFRVVATFKNNDIAPMLLPDVIYRLGKIYNNAFVLVETKSTGSQVATILHYTLEYENMLGAENAGRSGQKLTMFSRRALGISTSPKTKAIGCNNLKLIIENQQIFLNDPEIVEELSHFTAQKGSFGAEEGYNDDLVMTLVNFAWATTQIFFKNMSDVNVQEIVQNERQKIKDNLIFGFILEGDDEIHDNNGMVSIWDEDEW